MKIILEGFVKVEYSEEIGMERALLFDGKNYIVKVANFRTWEYKTLAGAERRYNGWGLLN